MSTKPTVYPRAARSAGAGLALALVGACAAPSPLATDAEQRLRESVVEATQREMAEARTKPDRRRLDREESELSFPPERMVELEEMAGPTSYTRFDNIRSETGLPGNLLGVDKDPEDPFGFTISLEQVVGSAVRNNLSVQAARIDPAVREAQVVAAQAAFDWVFFATFDWNNSDTPSTIPLINGTPIGGPGQTRQTVAYSTGIRKDLTSGGTFSASQGLEYTDDTTDIVNFVPNPSNATFVNLRLDQPLLRGFGSDVALSEIRLAQNLERSTIYALKSTLIDTVTEAERAYWDLYEAARALQVRIRLLDRGIETRDVLESRLGVDARPAEFSDAVARVESRRADVIRAINDVRLSSDRLKQLINDPELTVGSETLMLPIDLPVEEPIEFSLADSFATALDRRPDLQRAILAIDDASIRQTVARNARLPQLDIAVQATLRGLDGDVGESYGDIADGRFVSWLVSAIFEQPLGNRAADANYRARQLERLRATVDYRTVVQAIVLEVKAALRDIDTNFRLIEQTRSSRLAAAENLRTLLVLERTIASLSPDFLDLKFRRQESLAQAELEEIRALADYNRSLAEWNRATGSALERNGVVFVVPDADQLLDPDAYRDVTAGPVVDAAR